MYFYASVVKNKKKIQTKDNVVCSFNPHKWDGNFGVFAHMIIN